LICFLTSFRGSRKKAFCVAEVAHLCVASSPTRTHHTFSFWKLGEELCYFTITVLMLSRDMFGLFLVRVKMKNESFVRFPITLKQLISNDFN